jgi:hypothetical protein
MRLIKLFEAFKREDYERAFNHIKSLLDKDSSKEDIIRYIDNFNGDVAKELDNIRLIIDRTAREFNGHFTDNIYYNRKTKLVKKRSDGAGWTGQRVASWKKGDLVEDHTSDYVKYYIFPERNDSGGRRDKSVAKNFLESQKAQYNRSIEKVSHLDITRIKFFCDRFFEILDWVVETGPTKSTISHRTDISDEAKRTKIEELNDFDMDNEVEEITKIARRVGIEVKNPIDTI